MIYVDVFFSLKALFDKYHLAAAIGHVMFADKIEAEDRRRTPILRVDTADNGRKLVFVNRALLKLILMHGLANIKEQSEDDFLGNIKQVKDVIAAWPNSNETLINTTNDNAIVDILQEVNEMYTG